MKRKILDGEQSLHDIISAIGSLKVDISRAMVDYILDEYLLRRLEGWMKRLQQISVKIQREPRFDWMQIQEDMDQLYRRDKSIAGFRIDVKLRESEDSNFAHLKYQFKKTTK